MRPYVLAENNWKALKDQEVELAILPWGATEAHNYHLPYGTDNIETDAIAIESTRIAWERGAKAVVLPCIPFGVNTGQLDIKLTINLDPGTQSLILDNIIESLSEQGIYKLLIVNGHGGNDFKQILRELGKQYPKMFLATCNWFQAADKEAIFTNSGDHADESETSLMLYLSADLVLPLSEAGKGKSKEFNVSSLNEKWAWAERKWTKVTEDTGIGDPSQASSEKGEAFFRAMVEKISELIFDVSKMNPDKVFGS
ncbi:MAG: creatininase family protein [Candidatus Heimdallarchaeota archaeon]|nr:creatininase family protein [Candidatus Heimdallarchaeota archaeon]